MRVPHWIPRPGFARARRERETPAVAGAGEFALGATVFLRLLAMAHACAFGSLWVQLEGLIGPHGILPAGGLLRAAHEQLGAAAWLRLPTLCWLFGAEGFLHVLCGAGVVLALLLFAGIAPWVCLALLWVCYLSLVNVGQVFLGFQWDALLLETTLLACFLAPRSLRPLWRPMEPPPVGVWLLRWLLFRLMLLSGVVKLTSGDPAWHDLTALTFHYETQPLPNPLAFWAHQLPAAVQRACCAAMFAIELAAPFFLFAPRRARHGAALLLAALQGAIALTGNFAFFNLLTFALCLLALDDAWWRALRRGSREAAAVVVRPRWRAWQVAVAGAVVGYTGLLAVPSCHRAWRWPDWFDPVVAAVGPFASLNNYGLFAVMTTSRPELIFEGSDDGREWRAYEFRYKPGDLARRPPVAAPHQPRLDWQLWFAALGSLEQNRWVLPFCEHLLRGTPEVLALLENNPFPARPPRFVRVVRHDYRFATPAERAQTGRWWRRTPVDYYLAPASLR